MKTITIDRSKWRTGQEYSTATGKGFTRLKNGEGFKCCLGFICEAHGRDFPSWSTYPRSAGRIPFLSWIKKTDHGKVVVDTKLTYAAVEINDSKLPLEEKEKKLKELFKGKFKLRFVGVPVPYKD